MKKVINLLIGALIVLTMAACQSSKPNTDATTLDSIKSAGKIVVGLEGTWQPWSYHNEKEELVGFDVEVAKAVATKLGVEAEIVECEWDGLLAGLDSGRFDIVVNGVDVTEERSQKYNFTTPYAYVKTALIVLNTNEEIKTFEDLKGRVTANSIGSTYMELAESYGAEVLGIDTLEQTIEMLKAGRAEATLNSTLSFYDYMAVQPDAPIKIVCETEDALAVAIPTRKTDKDASLTEAISTAISELRAEGTLKQLSEKYFGGDVTSE